MQRCAFHGQTNEEPVRANRWSSGLNRFYQEFSQRRRFIDHHIMSTGHLMSAPPACLGFFIELYEWRMTAAPSIGEYIVNSFDLRQPANQLDGLFKTRH